MFVCLPAYLFRYSSTPPLVVRGYWTLFSGLVPLSVLMKGLLLPLIMITIQIIIIIVIIIITIIITILMIILLRAGRENARIVFPYGRFLYLRFQSL